MFPYARNINLDHCTVIEYNAKEEHHANVHELAPLLKASSPGAVYNSFERDPPARCHPGTRVGPLDKIINWVDAAPEAERSKALWLSGPAGSGKSSFAQTLCEFLADRKDLAASFFFSRERPDRESDAYLLPTIALNLATFNDNFRNKLVSLFKRDPLAASGAMHVQAEKLIAQPFSELAADDSTSNRNTHWIVVIDALDECRGRDAQIRILSNINTMVQTSTVPLRFIITCRPDPRIQYTVARTTLKDLTTTVTLSDDSETREDILAYLHAAFMRMRTSGKHTIVMDSLEEIWPGDSTPKILAQRAEGLFIYAATIVDFIDDDDYSPVDRLAAVMSEDIGDSSLFSRLDKLYRQILSTNPNIKFFKRILSTLLATDMPLPLETCAALLGVTIPAILLNLQGLHSILTVTPANVSALHKSLVDFIFTEARSGDYYLDKKTLRKNLYLDCVRLGTPTSGRTFTSTLSVQVQIILADLKLYKKLVNFRGPMAQKILDTFQSRLDAPEVNRQLRCSLTVAIQRLSETSGLYPRSYELKDIVHDDYPIMSGGFADIFRGTLRGDAVCIKVFRCFRIRDRSIFTSITNEAILWSQLLHPNIVPIYGMYFANFSRGHYLPGPGLVSPWMKHGQITEYLQVYPTAPRRRLANDVAHGLSYLHKNGVIHGDLKGPNILIDDTGRARIIDFGLSSVSDPDILSWTSHSAPASAGGTLRWQAPELFAGWDNDQISNNDTSSDVYAWACVCYEIFTNNVPFYDIDSAPEGFRQVVLQGKRPTRPSDSSPSWQQWGLSVTTWLLMEDCWKANPAERPTIATVISRLEPELGPETRPNTMEDALLPPRLRGGSSKPVDMDEATSILDGLLATLCDAEGPETNRAIASLEGVRASSLPKTQALSPHMGHLSNHSPNPASPGTSLLPPLLSIASPPPPTLSGRATGWLKTVPNGVYDKLRSWRPQL